MSNILNKKIDYLNEGIFKVLIKISLPLLIGVGVSILASFLLNAIYSKYLGEGVFAVIGSISLILTCLVAFLGAVKTATWIKTAKKYENKQDATRYLIQSVYTVIIFDVFICGLLSIFSENVLHLLNVKEEIFSEVKAYYLAYFISYFIIDVSGVIITVADGTGTPLRIMILHSVGSFISIINAYIFFGVLNCSNMFVAFISPLTEGIMAIIAVLILNKKQTLARVKLKYFKPDFKLIFDIIGYGFITCCQSIFVTIGEFFVVSQTNLLDLDYIACLSVSLPISSVVSPLFSSVNIFMPLNFLNGKVERVENYLKAILISSVLISAICAVIYAVIGEPYYRSLFPDNEKIIGYGAEYWIYSGISYIFLSILQPMRNFYESIGYNNVSLVEGIIEGGGKLICAFYLIPNFGYVGRNWSYLLGWIMGSMFLFITYFVLRRGIYNKCRSNIKDAEYIL